MNKQQNTVDKHVATKTAAIYLRLAAASQKEEQDVLALQRQRCEQVAAELGVTSVEVFTDAGSSANDLSRPGYVALLDYLRQYKPTYLIVTNGDRLSRNSQNMMALLRELQDLGVQLVSGSQTPDLHSLFWQDNQGMHRLAETSERRNASS